MMVYHDLLSTPGTRYQDLDPDYYEHQRDTRRQIAHHVGKLGALGFEVTLCRHISMGWLAWPSTSARFPRACGPAKFCRGVWSRPRSVADPPAARHTRSARSVSMVRARLLPSSDVVTVILSH
jgi:hypothetical protein